MKEFSERTRSKRDRAIAAGLAGMVLFGVIAFIAWNYHYLACIDANGDTLNTVNGSCPLFSQTYGVEVAGYVYPYRFLGVFFGLLSLAMLVYASVGGKER